MYTEIKVGKRRKQHQKLQFHHKIIEIIKGFTLIELLIVIAILGIVAAAILVAINPGKRMAQARDAQRKNDISAIANALIGYYTLMGVYPGESVCDSSIGLDSDNSCPPTGTGMVGTDWTPTNINQRLISQAFLKKLPLDPVNNSTYYYNYEPNTAVPPCTGGGGCEYYVGARLEAPDNPSLPIWRCTDLASISEKGCKAVASFGQ